MISVSECPGMSVALTRVSPDGSVTLPVAGMLGAAGLTIEQFQSRIACQLAAHAESASVLVHVVRKSEDQIVAGRGFRLPGIHALPAQRSLMSVIAAVGGLQPSAGSLIRIVSQSEASPIPLSRGINDTLSQTGTAMVNLSALIDDPGAEKGPEIKPGDILSVEPFDSSSPVGEGSRTEPDRIASGESPEPPPPNPPGTLRHSISILASGLLRNLIR